jgi:flagellar biosynthesis protein FlhA
MRLRHASVRILDNVQLDSTAYVIRVKEIEAGTGHIFQVCSWAMTRWAGRCSCPASTCSRPTFGLPAPGIDASLRDEASFAGYTVRRTAATVLSTHLTGCDQGHMAELLLPTSRFRSS